MDTRYLWESQLVRTPERGRALVLRTLSGRPITREGVLLVAHAKAGPLELQLYDLQGRVVLRQRGIAGGTGEDTVRFDLGEAPGPLRNGIYFAAVRDAAGESSGAVKLVILR